VTSAKPVISEELIAALRRNRFAVTSFSDRTSATDYLDASIDGKIVGFGDSGTLMQLGLYERLASHNAVHDPMHPDTGKEKTFIDTAMDCMNTQVFLTSVNAVAETGELVNIDGTGNRVAGSLFGHQRVYFVVGKNKITPTLEAALWRARNVAAPQNAKRLKLQTPCAVKGDKCYDCSSPQRICNGLMIHLKCMHYTEMEVVLIDEELGL